MIVILVLASLGILDAGYLSYIHLFGGQACGQWADCSFVLASPYSRIFGVPMSAIGLGAYLCFLFLALRGRDFQRKTDAVRWIFYISLIGNLLTGYLIYLQASVIKHWCPFCLLSSAFMLSIFVLNLLHSITNKGFLVLLKVPNWRLGLKFVLSSLILPSAIFFGIEHAIGVISASSITPDLKEVARIGERGITLGEVDHAVRMALNQIEWNRYEVRLSWLENELLSAEAERQKTTVEQLIKENVDAAVEVKEKEVQNLYQINKEKLSKIPEEVAKKQIINLLKAEKKKSLRQEYIDVLKKHYNITFSLPDPPSLVLDQNPRQGPEKGPTDAAVNIIMFTDFECPFCAKAYEQIKELLERYPQDIRVLFRHFPLEIHKGAMNAAYASVCAHLQGKFWGYADIIFQNQNQLELSNLYDYAEQIGLDMDIFKQCMESEQVKKIVGADITEGESFDIGSTPSFFFNGHFISGVPEKSKVKLILDQYLPKR